MLDVHPPHHAASTWRDFFIHIATIVIGLLIAVGLEQTVEYFHHRHQVAETREALRHEEEQNRRRFALETKWFMHTTPHMQKNIDILLYLRAHPHAPASAWPGQFNWHIPEVPYVDGAWKTAQLDGVIEHMPHDEVQRYTEMYTRISTIRELEVAERSATEQARSLFLRTSDPAQFSPAEIDEVLHDTTQVMSAHLHLATEQQRMHTRFPQFAPAPFIEHLASIPGFAPNPEDTLFLGQGQKELDDIDSHP